MNKTRLVLTSIGPCNPPPKYIFGVMNTFPVEGQTHSLLRDDHIPYWGINKFKIYNLH